MINNKLFLKLPVAAFIATVLPISVVTVISTYAQSAEEKINHSRQKVGESANKTGEAMQGNASELWSNLSEKAKNLLWVISQKGQRM